MKVVYTGENPRITVTPLALNKMQEYVRQSDNEIGWLGDVEVLGCTYKICDVFLVKQEVNGTTCELDSNAILDLYQSRFDSDISTDSIRLWGHSHVEMGVSPSGQDNKQLAELSKNSPFFIRLIMNKEGEMDLCLVDTQRNLSFEDVKWELDVKDISEEVRDEIAANVSDKVVAVPVGVSGYNGAYYKPRPTGAYNYGQFDWDNYNYDKIGSVSDEQEETNPVVAPGSTTQTKAVTNSRHNGDKRNKRKYNSQKQRSVFGRSLQDDLSWMDEEV